MSRSNLFLLLLLGAAAGVAPLACTAASYDAPSAGDTSELSADSLARCKRTPPRADRTRKVVVSHPYAELDGGGISAGGTLFEVLELSKTGALTKTGVTFDMGAAANTGIVFTPDGQVGIVAQTDANSNGTLGVFRFDKSGAVHVVHAAFKGSFYPDRVVMDPSGARAFVVDFDTTANHGGVYQVDIACDGTLTDRGLVVPGSTPAAMAFLPNSPKKFLLSAGAALGSPAGADTDLIDVSHTKPRLGASGTAFADGKAIASALTITPDGKYALIADNAFEAGNRIAVVQVDGLKLVDVMQTLNPGDVAMSPFGNAALVLNTLGNDALRVFAYDPSNASAPFVDKGEIAYKHGRPQLPENAVVIGVGSLKGEVLVAENLAVRQVAFAPDGTAADVGLVAFGDGSRVTDYVGVVGVQP